MTSLTGYNHEHDSQVSYMHKPGDPAEDDHFLKQVFHNHYTVNKLGEKVLTKMNAFLASKDVVKKWNHMSDEEAEQFLAKNFERVWTAADVNNEGMIKRYEAYTLEKSLLGSFSITYSDE